MEAKKSTIGKKQSKYVPGDFTLKAKRSSAGLGLYTMSKIKKGNCVIEYVGPVVPESEWESVNSLYLFEVTKKITINGAIRSNTARYINHSCKPNCEIETRGGRVFVMAKHNIKEGEELSYDYERDYFDEYIRAKGCKCGNEKHLYDKPLKVAKKVTKKKGKTE
jgi:SET domain-containing protein